VIFVAGALPGEQVRAEILRQKRDYAEARALEVLAGSPQRVTPVCPVYGRCGGCDLMHLDPTAQLKAKAGWVAQALSRLGPAPTPRLSPSPLSLGYRNRVRFQVSQGRLGFFATGSKELVEVESCAVAAGGVNRLLAGLRAVPLPSGVADLTGVEVLAGESGPGWVSLHFPKNARPSRNQRQVLIGWAREAGADGARLVIGGRPANWPLDREHGLVYYDGPPSLWAFPGIFCQVNFAANRLLVNEVTGTLADLVPGPVLDLYAGSGNFSFPLALSGHTVCAVEASGPALEAAHFLGEEAGLADQVDLIHSDAAQAGQLMVEENWGFAAAVLDPPRAGAKPLMPHLLGLEPKRVVYVSCHPAALARDAGLLHEAGYQMTRLSVVDMFPQTSQVEAVLTLDKG
jgi:23S rRNA (uracil1939-C5)-methyltransferase